jgi:hypothetical protein
MPRLARTPYAALEVDAKVDELITDGAHFLGILKKNPGMLFIVQSPR